MGTTERGKNRPIRPVVIWACRLILAGVFLYAGLIKATSSGGFALALIPFTFVPDTWIGTLALLLPLAEIAGGLAILIPLTSRWGAFLLLVLCLTFAAALGWALANDLIISCGCFGNDETPSRGKMVTALLRDLVLAALALAVMFTRPRK